MRTEDGKSLLESGIVTKHSTESLKVNVQLKLDRDYRKVRSMLREALLKEGYK